MRSVDPFIILVEAMLPAFVADARDQIVAILERDEKNGHEVPVQDGFDLYQEMIEIRRVHYEALPRYDVILSYETWLS